jgi:HopA1 effector protein family
VRMPRARDNIHPHRFTLLGGQGGVVTAHGFTKIFFHVSYEHAPALVETFSSRWADQLRFTLVVSNAPNDFARADSAVIDVAKNDEPAVFRILETFLKSNPKALVSKSALPFGTNIGPLGVPVANGVNKHDIADAFGFRICREAVAQ